MWNQHSRRSPLRDHMVLTAPEVNPHQFVQRYIRAQSKATSPERPERRETRPRTASADTTPISV